MAEVPRIEIAPGVNMPLLNFGIEKIHLEGIKHGALGLDTANVYGDRNQREVGEAVAAAIKSGVVTRDQLFVTSKIECCPGKAFMHAGGLACFMFKNATHNIEHDFKVLGLDYIDLLLLHWPCDNMDASVATYKAMEPYYKSGRVKALGISNFNSSALAQFLPRVNVKPVINQCGYSIAGHFESTSLWGRDDDTRRACESNNITYSAYSPLGGWAKGGTSHVLSDPTVKAVAKAHNVSSAAIALRWVTQQGVVAVTSSDKIEHVVSDVESFDVTLTPDEIKQLAHVETSE